MHHRAAVAFVFLALLSLSATAQDRGKPLPMPTPSAGITGEVTAVSGNLITLFNGAITIDTTGAKFSNRKGESSIADVKPGLQIIAAIKNPAAASGAALTAVSIIILDQPAGTLNGPVQSVDAAGSSLTVFGARVLITANTQIFGGRHADIKAGDTVAVEVSVNGSALTADVIHILPPMPNAFLEGTVASIGATSWVIATEKGNVTVIINAETRIDPSVKAGDVVHVSGIADSAGIITVLSIYAAKPRPEPPPSDETKIEGTVTSIERLSWVLETDGRVITLLITPDTKIEPGIAVNDKVIAVVKRDEKGNVIAVAIMKYPNKTRAKRG